MSDSIIIHDTDGSPLYLRGDVRVVEGDNKRAPVRELILMCSDLEVSEAESDRLMVAFQSGRTIPLEFWVQSAIDRNHYPVKQHGFLVQLNITVKTDFRNQQNSCSATFHLTGAATPLVTA